MSVENVFSNLSRMIEMVGKDKGIDKQIVVDAVVQGMLVAARKKYGTYREIEASYNEDSGEVELFEFKEVVKDEDFIDEEVEIKHSEALELDPEAQLDDSIGVRLETGDLGRIAAQTAKQIITQKVRDAEREIIFAEFDQRKGEVVSGIARRVERGAIVVDMGRTEAYLPPREQIPGEVFKPGDRIQGYIADVRQTTRGPQIIMSRADSRYLIKLFEGEVPEVYDGIVEIINAAREPGQRAKVAVRSKDPTVDPVGACVGMKGSRVQNIVQELRGEKIDIITFEEDPTRFVSNALAPAEISKIFVDDESGEMEVVVPDSQLSLAIGKRGQNVRLAARLCQWKLDIVSESDSATKTAEAIFNLMLIPNMTETMAQNIFQSGFASFSEIAESAPSEIMLIPGYDDEVKARDLIDQSQNLVDQYEKEGVEVPTMAEKLIKEGKAPTVTASNVDSSSKAQAEERLKEELELLKNAEDAGDSETTEAVAAAESETAEEVTTEESAVVAAAETESPSEGADNA